MTPATKEMPIADRVTGAPRVRIIDASKNAKKFEYTMTQSLEAQLRADGVAIEKTVFPKTIQEFLSEFGADGDFNTLIIVAHGEVKDDPETSEAVRIALADMVAPWLLLAHAPAKLDDKLVMLAVCGGHCDDTIFTFIRDAHLALLLFASTRKVTAKEVLAVFPPVLKDVQAEAASKGAFSGERLEAARQRFDTTNAFTVTSGVGIHP